MSSHWSFCTGERNFYVLKAYCVLSPGHWVHLCSFRLSSKSVRPFINWLYLACLFPPTHLYQAKEKLNSTPGDSFLPCCCTDFILHAFVHVLPSTRKHPVSGGSGPGGIDRTGESLGTPQPPSPEDPGCVFLLGVFLFLGSTLDWFLLGVTGWKRYSGSGRFQHGFLAVPSTSRLAPVYPRQDPLLSNQWLSLLMWPLLVVADGYLTK